MNFSIVVGLEFVHEQRLSKICHCFFGEEISGGPKQILNKVPAPNSDRLTQSPLKALSLSAGESRQRDCHCRWLRRGGPGWCAVVIVFVDIADIVVVIQLLSVTVFSALLSVNSSFLPLSRLIYFATPKDDKNPQHTDPIAFILIGFNLQPATHHSNQMLISLARKPY